VSDRGFVDFYELLQLSPNANSETVERVYRLLAKRYHPDNQATGNTDKFTEIREAYEVLNDPDKRAAYDSRYDRDRGQVWEIFDEASKFDGHEQDRRIFHGLLSLLYVARRRDVKNPGLGPMYLEKMLGCPQEHLEFPIWYLKQRDWIETLENGQLAITADGVDKVTDKEFELRTDRLLPESDLGSGTEDQGTGAHASPPSSESHSDGPADMSEDEIPDGSDFLDEAFADDLPPKARA
jgi:curved DNA-binding protein CbpA